MEQLVARRAHNPKVVGSNPSPATQAQIAQLVEQRTENPRVTGSIPVLGILFSRMSVMLTYFFAIWFIPGMNRLIYFTDICGLARRLGILAQLVEH